MKYMGFVADRTFLTEDERRDSKITFKFLNGPFEDVRSCVQHEIDRLQTLWLHGRVYSDEVPMCRGVRAFDQMSRVFKSKHPDKWTAWRAWKKLV